MSPETFCPWEPSTYWFFSSNVPDLVHYSHGIAIVSALTIALLVLFNNPKAVVPRLFFLFAAFVSIWTTLDVILWATNNPSVVMFSWAMQVLIEPVTYAAAFYMMYQYVAKKWPPLGYNVLFFATLLPLIILLPSNLNLNGLLLESCESIEGPLAKYYSYFANSMSLFLILFVSIKFIPTLHNRKLKVSAIYFTIGLITFLLSFTSGNVISSFTDDWTISQYGLSAMPVFAALIAYSIVRFNAFNIKMLGVQAIVVTLLMLVASLLLVVQSDAARLVSLFTLIFTTISGYFLVKSVRKEVQQREEIERLAKDLETSNEKLRILDKQKSEFVSIASHQLRSPLTAIRGYISLITEGSFGDVPEKMREALSRIDDSSRFMATSIDDFLNVSRIESGSMKYEYVNMNLVDVTKHVVEDLQSDANNRGLLLLFRTNLTHFHTTVYADDGKMRQILHNLINNALKYTLKGTVTVYVHNNPDNRVMNIEIIDTGLGMSKETLTKIFGKFTRAKIASSANIMGTGLGLFVAREMARAMRGDITAHSDGEGKGSRFVFTMPYDLGTTPLTDEIQK